MIFIIFRSVLAQLPPTCWHLLASCSLQPTLCCCHSMTTVIMPLVTSPPGTSMTTVHAGSGLWWLCSISLHILLVSGISFYIYIYIYIYIVLFCHTVSFIAIYNVFHLCTYIYYYWNSCLYQVSFIDISLAF